MSSWLIKSIIAAFLLPPGNVLLPLALAWFFRRRRWAMPLAAAACLLLLAQSVQLVAECLLRPLERAAGKPVAGNSGGAGAIVILAGGRLRDAPEYGGDTVSALTLERVRYGAVLARRFGLPVLVTGGSPGGAERGEAELMADVLAGEFGIRVRWIERESNDTSENAFHSAKLLVAAGVTRVILVTHAFHMERARRAFAREGLSVVPGPMGFLAAESASAPAVTDLLPRASAMRASSLALHEWFGLGWYEVMALIDARPAAAVGANRGAGVFSSAQQG